MSRQVLPFEDNVQVLFYSVMTNLKSLGVDYLSFSYSVGGERYYYSSDADWQKHCLHNDSGKEDPFQRLLETTNLQYVMWDSLSENLSNCRTLEEEKDFCGLQEGFSFLQRGQSRMATLSLGSKNQRPSFYTALLEKIVDLRDLMTWMQDAVAKRV